MTRWPRFPSLSLMGSAAWATVARFPWVLGTSLLGAAYAMWVIDVESAEPALMHVQLTLTLGIPLFLAVALYRERPRRPLPFDDRWLDIGALVLLVAHFLAAADDDTLNVYTRFAQLHLAAMLAVAFAGFAGPGMENGFWQFNRARFFRCVLSSLYAGVCFVGLALALKAIDQLFGITFHKAYPRLWFACAYGLLPWHFLAGMPPSLAALDRDREYPAPLRVFGQYLLVPLVTIYGAILYAYGAKILWTHAWPQGLVAWMVSAMAIFGVLVVLLLHPYQRMRDQTWIRAGSRSFHLLILPLLAMHLTAMAKRIGQYGITEHRYIQLVLAVWLAGLAVSFLTGLARNIKVVPMSLCALALATFAGPWGAYAVSRRSQQHRLGAIVSRNHLVAGKSDNRAKARVSYEDYDEMHRIMLYLSQYHGVDSLAAWRPGAGRTADQPGLPMVILASLGLQDPPQRKVLPDGTFSYQAGGHRSGFLPVSGFDGMWTLEYDFNAKFSDGDHAWETRLERGGRFVTLQRDRKEVARFPVQEMARGLVDRYGPGEVVAVPRDRMGLTVESAGARYRLCVLDVRGTQEGGRIRVNGGSGYLLIKRPPEGSR